MVTRRGTVGELLISYKMTKKNQIADFIIQTTRNRLVFCHEKIEDLKFDNIGKSLAEYLKNEDINSNTIAYNAEDFLIETLSNTNNDSTIGQYVAIDNIGILFEPDLGFNIKSIFDNTSRDKAFIICSDAQIKNNFLYFLQEGDITYVDLNGLSYIEL